MSDLVLGVTLRADGKSFVGEVKVARDQLKGLGDDADRSGRKGAAGFDIMGGAAERMRGFVTRAIGAYVGFQSITRIISSAADEIMAFEKSNANLNAVLRATGNAAGLTAKDLSDLADQIEGSTLFDDNDVRQAEAVMLTFRKVTGDTFREAIMLAADLSGLMGGDLQGAAVMLGKALQDPVEGITALKRVGIGLAPVQEDMIKKFMAAGQQAKAMQVVINEVAHQVGGVAKEQVTGLTGAVNNLDDSWGNLMLSLREGTSFQIALGAVGLLNRGVQGLNKIVDDFNDPNGSLWNWSKGSLAEKWAIPDAEKALQGLHDELVFALLLPDGTVSDEAFQQLYRQIDDAQRKLDSLRMWGGAGTGSSRSHMPTGTTLSYTPPVVPPSDPVGLSDEYLAKLKARQEIIAQFHLDQVIQQETDWRAAQQRGAAMVKEMTDATKRRTEADQQAGKTLTEQLMTPQEHYNASLAEYKQLLDAGVISQETFTRAVVAAGKELQSTDAIANELESAFDQAFDRIGQSITDMATQGKFQLEDLGNIGGAVISELLQELLKLSIINPLKNGLFDSGLPVIGDVITGLLNGLGSGGAGSGNAGIGSAFSTTAGRNAAYGAYHSGGKVGSNGSPRFVDPSVFAGAPRFHDGGLVAGEVPIIAKRGEEVGWPGQLADKYGAKVQVTVINSTGQQARTEE
ncbi:MAG: phage tail length tape measure family protein, partial [Hypericibacter sp.]